MRGRMPRRTHAGRTHAGRTGGGGSSRFGRIVLGCVLLLAAGITGVSVQDADAARVVNSGSSTVDSGSSGAALKARGDRFSTTEDQRLTVKAPGVLRNDKGSGRLSATRLSGPGHGVLTLRRDGSFAYAPDKDYNGKDSFTYKVRDGKGRTARATVTITVGPVNDAPLAEDGVAGMDEDGPPIPIDLGALVSDKETADADLTYAIVSGPGPEQGVLSGPAPDRLDAANTGPRLTFDSADGYNGSFDIVYTATDRGDPDDCGAPGPGCDAPETSVEKKVTVTVNRVNNAPVITALTGGPDTPEVDEGDAPYTYDFVVADDDPGDGFTVKDGFPDCGTGGEYVAGSLTTTATGGSFRCRFVDGPNTPTVRLQVNDGAADSAVVTRGGPTVNNVRPTVAFEAFDPQTGANDATVDESTTEKRKYTFVVTDPGDDTFSIEDTFPKCGQNGTLSGTATTTATGGSFECVFPDGDTTSNVEIKVKDSDGATDADNQVVTVTVANAAPSATFEASDPVDEGGDITLSLTNASDPAGPGDAIEYRFKCGDADWTAYGAATTATCPTTDDGAVTVKGQVRDEDGGQSEEYQKTVTVRNVAPTITSVTNNGPVDEGSPVTVTVNASDPAGANDPLSYEFDCENDGTFGTASAQNTAECTYASAGGKTVSVRVSDRDGGVSEVGSTTVTVRRVNAQPVAGDGTASMDEDASPITINFADFASDEETADANLTYDITAPDSSKGTLTGTGSTRTFTPAGDFSGTVDILYTVADRGDPDGCDPTGPDCSAPKTSAQGKVTVTVRSVNDAPVLTAPASISVDEDVSTALTGISASDVDAGSGSVVLTLSVPSGALTATSGGGVTVGGTGRALTLTGTVADVNSFIAASGIEFTTDQDATADVALTTAIDDGGNTGSGGAKSDAETTTIDVQPVNDAPVADDESFSGTSRAVGNTSLIVNDTDDGAPDPSGPQKTITGDILDGDTDVDGSDQLAIQAETKATNDGGSVTIEVDGDFTFHPKAGTSCTDNSDFFDYTVTDQNSTTKPGTPGTDTGRVTVEIQDCVWYVDGSAGAGGDGRSHSPFNSLTGVNGVGGSGDSDASGQRIFVYDGTYSGGLPLENNQTLLGERHGLSVSDGGSGNVQLVDPGTNNTQVDGGLTLASGNTIQGIHLGNNASGAALSGSSVGTATMNTATSGAINNQNGKAVDISNGTLDMAFTGVSSNNSSTDGIRLDNLAGTFNAAGGSVQNAAEQDIDISGNNSGDTVDFTYNGSTTDDTGALIAISGQSGGTKDFNGAITDLNDGDGAGISLTNNPGATIRFDGGLTLSTGGNAAFAATGGGTLAVTDPAGATDNTIATTTGTALNVANTNIGSDGLNFRSISANGGANGIVLNNTGTSGGLTITGSGTTANSGGTIQNTTGDAVSLNSTGGHSFNLMRLTNLPGGGFYIRELTGNNTISKTTIENFNVSNQTAIDLNNSTANNGHLTLDANLIQHQTNANGMTAVSAMLHGGVNFDLDVIDSNIGDAFESKFTDLFGSAIVVGPGENGSAYAANMDLTVSNTKFTDAFLLKDTPTACTDGDAATVCVGGIGDLEMTVQGNSTIDFDITNNLFDNVARGNASAIVGIINFNATDSGRISGTPSVISGNTIQNIGASTSIAEAGYVGMRIAPDNSSAVNHKLLIQNNTIKDIIRQGVLVSARDQAVLNAKLEGNTVGTLAEPVGQSNRRGVEFETQASAVLNAEVINNPSIVGAGTSNSNSSLHFRSGVTNPASALINATVTGNTIGNTNAGNNTGRFRAETVSVGAGSMCLDLRGNTLEAASKEFNLQHNSAVPGVFNLNQSGNTGTVTNTGTRAIGTVPSCTRPGF